jgi:hypothetical protein
LFGFVGSWIPELVALKRDFGDTYNANEFLPKRAKIKLY